MPADDLTDHIIDPIWGGWEIGRPFFGHLGLGNHLRDFYAASQHPKFAQLPLFPKKSAKIFR